MHALFFTPAFPPFDGGGERYARSLALALAACEQKVTIITSHARREQQLWLGTPETSLAVENDGPLVVIRCPLRPFPGGWRGLLAWRKLMVLLSLLPGDQAALLDQMARRVPSLVGLDRAAGHLPSSPDLVHAFNLSWEHALLAARDFAQARRLPLIVTPFAHFGSGKHDRVARNATMDHQRRLLRQAHAILTLTTVEEEGFARWNIKPQRLVVAGGGVDAPPPLPPDAGSTAVGRYALQTPFALFIGRANFDKGAIHAAQATLDLARHGAPITLALAGRIAPDFQRFVDSLDGDARSHLHVLGPVPEADKHALLQEATMLLLPSRAESFGIVLLEAWQHATPVVAARAGGIPAVVDHGENGLLVPFADVPALSNAMQRLLADAPLRRSLGVNGQRKVRRDYTWPVVASRVLSVYQEVSA